jgi:hypothetical protein
LLSAIERPGRASRAQIRNKVSPVLDDNGLEARLRQALSQSAPPGLATIGVREMIVDAVRARRARRHRVGGALAATCLVVAGVAVGISVQHGTAGPGRISAQSALAPRANPTASAAALPVPSAGCGEVAVGGNVVAGCAGAFGRAQANAPLSAASPTASRTGTSEKRYSSVSPSTYSPAAGGAGSGGSAGQTSAGYEVVVPVGRPVTLVLPGSPGDTWTAPGVVPGQGADASRVRTVSAHVGGVGEGSSVTFVSPVAVTVVVDASELAVCGSGHTECGTPIVEWSVVLEFRAS